MLELSGVLGLRLKRQDKDVDAAPFMKIFDEVREKLEAKELQDVNWPTLDVKNGNASQWIDALLDIRVKLRDRKLWQLSDQIRDNLAKLGVLVEDSAGGSSWRWE